MYVVMWDTVKGYEIDNQGWLIVNDLIAALRFRDYKVTQGYNVVILKGEIYG